MMNLERNITQISLIIGRTYQYNYWKKMMLKTYMFSELHWKKYFKVHAGLDLFIKLWRELRLLDRLSFKIQI